MRMIPLGVVVAVWLAACSPEAVSQPARENGTVTAITGPLSFAVEAGDSSLEVRLSELDAPDEALAREALQALVLDARVWWQPAGQARDRYDRALAYVFLAPQGEPGGWVQGELVRSGAARVLSHADTRLETATLLALEAEARAGQAGIWGDARHGVRRPDPNLLAQDVGSVQLVEGRVISATQLRSGRIYLNFGADYRTDFTVFIAAEHADAFLEAGLGPDALETRRIRVRGWVEDENGPMIRIDHPERIEVLPDGP